MHADIKLSVKGKMSALLQDLHAAVEEKKKAEEKVKRLEDEKMEMQLQLADLVHDNKRKAEEAKLKLKKIRKYVRDKENHLLYALAALVILVSVVIALSDLSRCRK